MSASANATARILHDALDDKPGDGSPAMMARLIADDIESDGWFGPATTRAAWLSEHGPPEHREFFRRLGGSLRKACTLDP